MGRLARCDNPRCPYDQRPKEVELVYEGDDRLFLKDWVAVEILGPLDKRGRPAWEPPATLGQPLDTPAPPLSMATPWVSVPTREDPSAVVPGAPTYRKRFLFCSVACTAALQELTPPDQSSP